MAVQQNKKSRSRSGMRRGSHAKIPTPTLSINPLTGQAHRRHHIAADGTYRGKQYLITTTHEEGLDDN
ncbi:50S ribosomal protein L32 [bacterium]|jgi:large subunit ribosomal protein L32|nr:50S ribosomal protein L32 [bacterium]NBW56255.1 50S ribosomal protein L32 [bacterium]NBX72357.1 50S ribosomal protein L32 [bacterium]